MIKKIPFTFTITALLSTFMLSCTQDDSYIERGISGKLHILTGTETDSDTNNPNVDNRSNNSIQDAQRIANPVQLGGHVGSADTNDYFSVRLAQGQIVQLSATTPGGLLTLNLLDSTGLQIDTNSNTTNVSLTRIVAPSSGEYHLNVRAISASVKYVLTTNMEVSTQDMGNAEIATSQPNKSADFVPGEIIVEFDPEYRKASSTVSAQSDPGLALSSQLKLKIKAGDSRRSVLMQLGDDNSRNQTLSALNIQTSQVTNATNIDATEQLKRDTVAVVQKLKTRPGIKSARLNYVRKALFTPNDSLYDDQWHYPQIDLPEAWDVSQLASNNTIVAVIDSGISSNVDLNGQTVPGFNTLDGNSNTTDAGPDFHGSHVAGTIAAATNNGVGVAGVAGFNARIMPIKALSAGGGSDYSVEQGVRYAAGLANDFETAQQTAERRAAGNVADVINMSLGGPGEFNDTPSAYVEARAAGVILIAAAGNERSSAPSYPAVYPEVISVSAVDIKKVLTPYSNYGSTIAVAAPGGDTTSDLNNDGLVDGVLSTINNAYMFKQGTSMASPHVAGVAALMKSVHPALTPQQFESALASGALTTDIGAFGRDPLYGHGLINACKAVLHAATLANITNLPVITSKAHVAAGTLNVSHQNSHIDFEVTRSCGTTPVTVTTISSSEPWLTVTPANISPDGTGTYRANINRSILPEAGDIFTAEISVSTNTAASPMNIHTIVQRNPSPKFVGQQYILLYKIDGPTLSYPFFRVSEQRRIEVDDRTQSSNFIFTNIPAGIYMIVSTTDMDADGSSPVTIFTASDHFGIYCDLGEACAINDDLIRFEQNDRVSGVNIDVTFNSNQRVEYWLVN